MKAALYTSLGLLSLGILASAQADSLQTIGWIERVKLQTSNLVMQAKIDTGADNSSLHADDIVIYHANGQKKVKFSIENKAGNRASFDLPLVHITQIKRKGTEPLNRPVVNMLLCIGNTLKTVNVNLANRSNFKYRMLIGRSYLKDLFLVNSSVKYTTEPSCGTSTAVRY